MQAYRRTAPGRLPGPALVLAWTVSVSTSGSEGDRVGYLLDRLDIYDCLVRYTRGLDRHDSDLIASAFWPDAQVNYGTLFSGLRDEFVAWANELESQNEYHAHHIGTQTVDLDGDIAHVETYVLYIVRTREKVERLGSGRPRRARATRERMAHQPGRDGQRWLTLAPVRQSLDSPRTLGSRRSIVSSAAAASARVGATTDVALKRPFVTTRRAIHR
jgi:hypothetical protein